MRSLLDRREYLCLSFGSRPVVQDPGCLSLSLATKTCLHDWVGLGWVGLGWLGWVGSMLISVEKYQGLFHPKQG